MSNSDKAGMMRVETLHCDDCGEETRVRQVYDHYAVSFGASHKMCKECYEDTPEPDTGRPDWEDL